MRFTIKEVQYVIHINYNSL